MLVGIIIGAVVLLLIIFVISSYNKLVKQKVNVEEAFATMDVYLKKRFDLIPNLVETVKGYAKHEKETLEGAIRARNSYVTASTPEEQLKNAGELERSLSRLMMLQESYPDLKANANFMSLQNDLKETEDKISYARQFYNDDVKQYVNKLEMFPSNIIASMFHFEKMNFFEVDEASKEVPKVQF